MSIRTFIKNDFKETFSKVQLVRVSILFLIVLMVFMVYDADAAISSSSNVIKNELSSFVDKMVNGASPLSRMTWIFFWFFTFLLVIKNVYFFVMKAKDFDICEVTESGVYFVFALVLLLGFDWYTQVIWEYSNGAAAQMQHTAFGNSDPFFFVEYIINIISNIEVDGVGLLTDGLKMVAMVLVYEVLAIALGVCAKIAALWATWGYALSKLIGLIFIPFVLLDSTRFLFSGWLRLFLGFMLFNIMVRAAMVVIAFQIRADFIELGGSMSGSTGSTFVIAQKVVIKKGPLLYAALGDIIGTAILALFFVYFAAKASSALVGGGGASSGAGSTISRAISAAFGKVK